MKKLLIIAILLTVSVNLYAQDEITMPSPEAASLAKYADLPVNMFTGTPNISIDLHTVRSRSLQVPISISYHASGIKVEEIASSVGLGWSLNAGGVITRSVRGLPDDFPNGYLETLAELNQKWSGLTPGSLFTENDGLEHYDFVKAVAENTKDTQPDDYFFNYPGGSGKFVIEEEDLIHIAPKSNKKIVVSDRGSINPSGAMIQNHLSDNFLEFKIYDEDGTMYVFEDLEYTESWTNETMYVSSWYLTRIVSPSGGDEIEFEYIGNSPSVPHNHRWVKHENQKYYELIEQRGAYCSTENETFIERGGTVRHKPLRLNKITSATEEVLLHYSLRDDGRHPDDGHEQEYRLDSLVVKDTYTQDVKRKFTFDYGYFQKSGVADSKRLRLDSVREWGLHGNDPLPPYEFTYNTSVLLPSRLSKAVDHWGYYNGKTTNNTYSHMVPELILPDANGDPRLYPGINREPSTTHMKAAMLELVQYPTGGTVSLVYEPHKYGFEEGEYGYEPVTTDWGAKQSTTTGAVNQTKTTDFIIDAPQGEVIPVTLFYELIVNDDNERNCPLSGSRGVCVRVSIKDSSENEIFSYSDGDRYEFTFTMGMGELKDNKTLLLEDGTYTLKAYSYANNYFAKIDATWRDLEDADYRITGGVRIESQVSNDGFGNTYYREYNYTDNDGQESGYLIKSPRYHTVINYTSCPYMSRRSTPVIAPGSTQGSSIGYRNVNVRFDQAGVNGQNSIIYDNNSFISDEYYGTDDDLWPFSVKTSNDWKRGKLTHNRSLNNSDEILQEIEYSFDTHMPAGVTLNALIAEKTPVVGQTITEPAIFFRKYQFESRPVLMNYSSTSQYEGVTTETTYAYTTGTPVQLRSETHTNSDGKQRVIEYLYAHEEYSPMYELNMLTQPYAVFTKDGHDTILHIQWTLWDEFGTDRWFPCGIWRGGANAGESAPTECLNNN